MTSNILPAARSGKGIVMQHFNQREPRVLWRATCIGIGLLISLLAGAPRVVEAEIYLRVDHSDTAEYDVLVIGGGCAALSAAITAREQGVNVLLLECAPMHFRGAASTRSPGCLRWHSPGSDTCTSASVPGRCGSRSACSGCSSAASAAVGTCRPSGSTSPWGRENPARFARRRTGGGRRGRAGGARSDPQRRGTASRNARARGGNPARPPPGATARRSRGSSRAHLLKSSSPNLHR